MNIWKLRAIEYAMAIGLAAVLILIAFTLGGCASIAEYKQEKALLLAPAPLNSPASKQVIVDSYSALMSAAQNDPRAVPQWIDAGMAVNTSSNVQTDVLLAPSPYTVQTTLLGMLGSCGDQLRADAPGLSFGQAYVRLEGCSRVCSFESAQAAANNALTTTVTTVHPVSGAVRTMARP